MAPSAYQQMQEALSDARFDAFMTFLEGCDFGPEVNLLEERLVELLHEVGGRRELCAIGNGEGETSLAAVRENLVSECEIETATPFTVVAADSVHSSVREWVRGKVSPVRRTHEQIARIRIVGEALPSRLGAADQVRLSKVLGSVLDYRLNRNGFAEVDLFLSPREFALVRDLDATPKSPVRLDSAQLGRVRAPLFRGIVEHLERGLGGARREVLLQSTFRLEHARMPKLTFARPDLSGHVFLIGDAGVSLPFQRGMSCLAHCALSLARIHVELLSSEDPEVREGAIARYDREVDTIVERELAIVQTRAQLVRTLREIVRLSALLPFPIQSWWLRAPDAEPRAGRLSLWFFLNLLLATSAFALAIGGSLLTLTHAVAWLAVPTQALGGVAYHAALAFEGGPHRLVRRIWEIQIAALFFAGVGLFVRTYATTGRVRWGPEPLWWLILAAAFVAGLYVFEGVVSRWFRRAGLRFSDEEE